MRRRTKWLIAGTASALAVVAVGVRLARTAEWTLVFGSDRQRADLCRSVPDLAAWRQDGMLARLLDDPVEEVRSAAITAYGRVRPRPAFDRRLAVILKDPQSADVLRSKAGTVLLGRDPIDLDALAFVRAQAETAAFRRACPRLVARIALRDLPGLSKGERRALLAQSFDEQDPACEALQEVVREHMERFGAFRAAFVERLAQPASFRTRQFLVSALAAIDGSVRGQTAADWSGTKVVRAVADAVHAFEAEWVTELRPNYQIGRFHGERCLVLGEGAGGYMHWLKGHAGTVDIGTARFSLFLPADGPGSVWARVYLDDKCGNSFGLWVDGKAFRNFRDRRNVFGRWHWLHLKHGKQPSVEMKAGFHPARLEAWEDGVYIDKFALLPAGQRPEALPDPPAMRWDPGLAPAVSFAPERQAQSRGTTQVVVVWIRRSRPDVRRGTVTLHAPPPFAVKGTARTTVAFEAGNPLARTSFCLHLPAHATAGEGWLRAVYADETGRTIEGRMILGAQFDWLTTGPLAPDSSLDCKLREGAAAGPDRYVRSDWKPYPEDGYDAYRRLTPEDAFGQLRDRVIYLCADLEATKDCTILGLLTADDTARVYLDDELVIAQPRKGPGEGRLVQKRFPVAKGRHRLFVRLRKADKPDPRGPKAGRHSFNHCTFKLLLRRSRHQPAPEIRGLPHPLQ